MYWLNLTFACGGVLTRDGHIVETAPIFKWMIGNTLPYVLSYCVSRGQFIEIQEVPRV